MFTFKSESSGSIVMQGAEILATFKDYQCVTDDETTAKALEARGYKKTGGTYAPEAPTKK